MAYLIKLLGPRAVRVRIEVGQSVVVGRSEEAAICLDDKLVSRRHCEFVAGEQGVLVRDFGSRNGTSLNGAKLTGDAIAHPGDQVKVGSHFLLLERPGETPPPGGKRGSAASGRSSAASGEARGVGGGGGAAGGLPPRRPGLPGYELLEELGQTRTGRVFHARSLVDGRMVAVKVLEAGSDPAAVARFEQAATALARLDHPNIVRVFETGCAAGTHYVSMERIRGRSLGSMLREGPLGVREALAVAVQVARALRLAHEQEVVHRDLSPDNIHVLPGGIAKLLGFSFAKSLTGASAADGPQLTGLGEMIGDLCYTSPEQARDPRSVDHRSDLYALGAVLYHAIAGRPPFAGQNHLETLRLVLGAEPASLDSVVPGVPLEVSDLVAWLLAKSPADRPDGAEAVERALEDALLAVCGTERDRDDEARSFGGGFSGPELLEIAQFLEVHRKVGRLVVSAPPLEGELVLVDGRIVQASAGQLLGEEAALALLARPEGTFRFLQTSPDASQMPAGALSLRPSALAIEVLRSRDERASR